MKQLIPVMVAAASLTFAANVNASEATKAIVASYLKIQAALAADKTDGIKPAAQEIAKQAATMGASGAAIAKASKVMEGAADIKAARAAFAPLSDAVIKAASADDWKDVSGVKLGFCPMVGHRWVQKDGQVSNPYYGKQMLTCGELKNPK